jgi:hypothetical protein
MESYMAMTDAEIQARATIAAALIHAKVVDLGTTHLSNAHPSADPSLTKLRDAVNRVYAAITSPVH